MVLVVPSWTVEHQALRLEPVVLLASHLMALPGQLGQVRNQLAIPDHKFGATLRLPQLPNVRMLKQERYMFLLQEIH